MRPSVTFRILPANSRWSFRSVFLKKRTRLRFRLLRAKSRWISRVYQSALTQIIFKSNYPTCSPISTKLLQSGPILH
jgi:hypothetical protein